MRILKSVIGTSSHKNGMTVYDRFFVCFFVTFCIGVIIGALLCGKLGYGSDNAVFKVWEQNFTLLKTQSFFWVFLDSFLTSAAYIAVIYSLGVCAVGSVFLLAPCFAIGVGKGVFFGFLYLKGSVLDYAYAIVFVLLQNIVFCLAVLLLLCLSLKMSTQIFAYFAKVVYKESEYLSFRKYNQWYLIALAVLFLNCVVDTVLMRFYF